MIVSRCSGGSDNGAEGSEGLTDEVGSIDLAEGHSLLLERIHPIHIENQINLSVHVCGFPGAEYTSPRLVQAACNRLR